MFEGSGVALVTPFRNGELDEKKLTELVELHISDGTSMLVPCGTTGESSTLTHKEHGRVVELVIKAARKRIQVIAGTGSNSTRETIELTHRAQSRDAFARGALAAALFLAKKSKGLYQMSDILK